MNDDVYRVVSMTNDGRTDDGRAVAVTADGCPATSVKEGAMAKTWAERRDAGLATIRAAMIAVRALPRSADRAELGAELTRVYSIVEDAKDGADIEAQLRVIFARITVVAKRASRGSVVIS